LTAIFGAKKQKPQRQERLCYTAGRAEGG